jgi:hypothetical protein
VVGIKYLAVLAVSVLMAASARAADDKTLLQPFPSEPKLNEIIAFEVVPNHHFNLQSKTNCGNGRLISEKEQLVECQMYAPGTSELQLYVCDDAKTFCRREVVKVTTQQPSGLLGWLSYYKDQLTNRRGWSSPFKSGVSVNTVARGFIHNELKGPLATAKREKKKIFLYFTQLTCPPCRLMKEMTFASDEFQALMKDYVPVQIDLDLEIEPAMTKPLQVQHTPAVIILDGDFKEYGRATYQMSPAAFKEFLGKLPSAPVKEIGTDDPKWQAEYDKLKTPAEKIGLLSKLNLNEINFNTNDPTNYIMGFYEPIVMMKLPADKALFKRAMGMLDAFEARIKASGVDSLQMAYNLNNYYGVMAHFYKIKNLPAESKAILRKLTAVIDAFPKLPGVTETNQLTVLKAESMEDPAQEKQAYDEMRSKFQQDYTYDFWEAGKALMDQDYEKALVAIDKSLALAKDRSWQKAFLMKLDILKALKRNDEALKLIEDLLSQMKLPEDSAMRVHGFVQDLRRMQVSLKKPSQA